MISILEAKAVRQRVYLGGLMDNVTPEDIEQRFKPFGTISNLCISYDSTGGKQ
jgi:RNA recognition motif-containing protein